MIEPRKQLLVRADAVSGAEGYTVGAEWPGAPVSPGSDGSRACIEGVCRELGRPRRLRGPEVAALEQSSMPLSRAR